MQAVLSRWRFLSGEKQVGTARFNSQGNPEWPLGRSSPYPIPSLVLIGISRNSGYESVPKVLERTIYISTLSKLINYNKLPTAHIDLQKGVNTH